VVVVVVLYILKNESVGKVKYVLEIICEGSRISATYMRFSLALFVTCVLLSVCLSTAHNHERCQMADPIEMSFQDVDLAGS